MTKEETIRELRENPRIFRNNFIDDRFNLTDITKEENDKLELLTNLSCLFPYISLSIFIKDILKLEDRLENLNIIDDDDGNKFIEEKECFFSLIREQDFFKERFVGMEDYRRLEQSKTDIEEQFKKTKRIEQEKNSLEDNIRIKSDEFIIRSVRNIDQSIPNTINGHEYVDLGLPSGLKWATCNVGANKPEDYGNYYAWGETSTKSSYTKRNSKTFGKEMNNIKGDSQYDAARANWGSTWRMPTESELEELKNECTWKRTTQNGAKGYRVIGPNGNSIFLPAAGNRVESSLYDDGYLGVYWSSTPYDDDLDRSAYGLYFSDGNESVYDYGHRGYGLTVRPVSE